MWFCPPAATHVMKKILIVEDHADIRRLVRMTLEFEDCEIHEAADAQAGWDQARRVCPDIVLLDVMMPGPMSGLDLCRALRADPQLRGARIVMLTAMGSSMDRDAGLRAGADAYLVKPFSPMQLLDMLVQPAF
jgi:DNA-binding response OmpR family regulator